MPDLVKMKKKFWNLKGNNIFEKVKENRGSKNIMLF